MRLCKDTTPGARNVRVLCVSCEKMTLLSGVWADRDGAAFVDYYCDHCEANHLVPSLAPHPHYIDGAEVFRDRCAPGGWTTRDKKKIPRYPLVLPESPAILLT